MEVLALQEDVCAISFGESLRRLQRCRCDDPGETPGGDADLRDELIVGKGRVSLLNGRPIVSMAGAKAPLG
ncbi:MAG: hypothetical protein NVS9B1_23740 [Candidatus Dormibacteraceae bacterium]